VCSNAPPPNNNFLLSPIGAACFWTNNGMPPRQGSRGDLGGRGHYKHAAPLELERRAQSLRLPNQAVAVDGEIVPLIQIKRSRPADPGSQR
jgi:hypothetical protein